MPTVNPGNGIEVVQPAGETAIVKPESAEIPKKTSGIQKLLSIFSPAKQNDITTIDFDPGETDIPSLEGALRDVNITYTIEPPYQYVHIEYIRAGRGARL